MTAPWTPNGPPAAPPGQRQWQHLPVPDVNAQPQPLPPSPVPTPQHTAPAEQRQEWAQPYFPPQGAPLQQPQQNSPLPPTQPPQAYPVQQPAPVQPPPQQFQGTPLVWQDANGRLFGQGVPAHLQGMTMQQVQALQSQPRPQVQQQPHQQPGYQQAPAAPQQAPAATPAQKSFWSDPEGAIERIVDRKMAPVTASTQNASIVAARQSVAQRFPNFNEYAAEIEQQLANVDPEVLTNPAAWQYAFERAVGARALGGAQGGFQQAPVPAQPVVPAGSFFTESPSAGYTPGSQNMTGDGNFGLSVMELDMARRMSLSPQEYARGKGLQV